MDPRRCSRRAAFAVRRQCHFIDPRCATGVDRLLDRGAGRVEVNDLERAVAVTGVEPASVRGDAVRTGDIVVQLRRWQGLMPTKPPMVRFHVRVRVSMTTMPALERSAR